MAAADIHRSEVTVDDQADVNNEHVLQADALPRGERPLAKEHTNFYVYQSQRLRCFAWTFPLHSESAIRTEDA